MTLSDEFHVHLTYFGRFVTFFGKKKKVQPFPGGMGLSRKKDKGILTIRKGHIFLTTATERGGGALLRYRSLIRGTWRYRVSRGDI